MQASKLNFISCVGWIRKGVSKEIPDRCQLTREQIRSKIENDQQKLKELTGNDTMEIEDIEPDNTDQQNVVDDEDRRIMERYQLDNYDDEDNDDDDFLIPDDTESDPYLNREQVYSDDEEEKENFKIKPTDNLILCGHVEEDSVSLEIKVYNQDETYVHHEIYLEAYPLCFQWLDFKNKTQKGNLVAVGDMKNDINIWDIDLVDSLDPFATLVGHQKSVLDLSWNPNIPNVLASASADQKCFLWDLEEHKCVQKFKEFKAVINSIEFHPLESNILLTGDSNGNVKMINCQTKSLKNFKICRTEIEKVVWNPYQPYIFFCADSNGTIYSRDCRNENSNLGFLSAHDGMISGMEFSSSFKNCLMTTSSDEKAKVWKINDQSQLEIIEEIKPKIGTILSLAANPDYPNIFAMSGNDVAQNFQIIDICLYPKVKEQFQKS